jgi:enterochelin esterase-like enzyme
MKHAKRCVGLLVAAAMVIPMAVPGAGIDAKAAKPKLSTKTVKVNVGAKKKVTVKNAAGFKIAAVKSKKKAIATVTKKGKTAFIVKGVKAGDTKAVCTVKKGKKKFKLSCKVKVSAGDTKATDKPVASTGTTAANAPASVPTATQGTVTQAPITAPTATPEPSIGPFPKTDKFSEVPYAFDNNKENVKKGDFEEITYKSSSTGTDRKVLVQLPANYSQDKKYPVLYLLHGGTDTETAWKDMAADQIIANLTAFKLANEMIVVMPNIRVAANDGAVTDSMSADNIAAFEKFIDDFKNDLKPTIESKYSVAKGRCNTAVAGYDLGGRIALCIGVALADEVAYTGAFAPSIGVIPNDQGGSYFGDEEFKLPEKYSDQSFLMIQKGTGDNVVNDVPSNYNRILKANGTECLFLEMDGGHDANLFKAGLYNFARRIFKRGTDNEGIVIGNVTRVPAEIDNAQPNNKGTIEVIEYDTQTYDPDNSVPIHKKANVFLPYGYDSSKKYNILYLMHGYGENEDTWIKGDRESNPNGYGDYTQNQKMINVLFEQGICEPCIIVNPTFFRPEGAPEPENVMDLTYLFQYELRNDLIPAVESKYSTYANGDTSVESLKASRMHRGFAGLSMGSNTTYRSAFYGNYDLFAWFGPYSGYFTTDGGNDAQADLFNKVIEEGEANGLPLGYIYCGNGADDFALEGQFDVMEKALIKSKILVPGRNYDFVTIPGGTVPGGSGKYGEHSMWSWHIHLYNTLRIFFTKE